MRAIQINPHVEIRRETISRNQYCVIVDDFLQDPHEVVEYATDHAGEFSMPKRGNYPGPLRRVDGDAMTDIYGFIRSKMTRHFPFLRGNMSLWTYLSMTTMRRAALASRTNRRKKNCPGRQIYVRAICHDHRVVAAKFQQRST